MSTNQRRSTRLLNEVNSILKEHDLEVIFDITPEAYDLSFRQKGLYSAHEIEAAFFLINSDQEVICFDTNWRKFMNIVEKKYGEIFMNKTRLTSYKFQGDPDRDSY